LNQYRFARWRRGLPAVFLLCLSNTSSSEVFPISCESPPLREAAAARLQGMSLGGTAGTSPCTPFKGGIPLFLSHLAPLHSMQASAENPPLDLKAAVVEAFMSARALENNVEARKLMTAHLEHDYLHKKRLSIRVRSSRIVSFDFDPGKITQSGDKEFNVEVESIWADLNEQVFATQYERIKFFKVKNEWLADGIDFIRSVPAKPLLPLNVESDKRAELALAVVKKFLKAVANREPKSAIQFTTQEFQTNVGGQNKLEELLTGPAEPHYTAFDLRTFTQKDKKEIQMKIGLYLVQTGKRGGTVTEARLTLRLGRTEWNVDDFQIESSGLKPSRS
jgi:hypothetical protein